MEILTINPQVVRDSSGHELGVFLPMEEFKKLLEELEDYEDAKTLEEYDKRTDKEFIPLRQALDEIEKGLVK